MSIYLSTYRTYLSLSTYMCMCVYIYIYICSLPRVRSLPLENLWLSNVNIPHVNKTTSAQTNYTITQIHNKQQYIPSTYITYI